MCCGTWGSSAWSIRGWSCIIDEATRRAADRLWQQAGLPDHPRVIGINTGGSWPSKRWTVEGFAALAELLQHEGYCPVFFGGTSRCPDGGRDLRAYDHAPRAVSPASSPCWSWLP